MSKVRAWLRALKKFIDAESIYLSPPKTTVIIDLLIEKLPRVFISADFVPNLLESL